MRNSWDDTAQICTNGHIINSVSISHPEYNRKFCDKCGAPTITNCQKCNSPIKGYCHVLTYTGKMFPSLLDKMAASQTELERNAFLKREAYTDTLAYTNLSLPPFCPDCGEPYPWTEAKLKAAKDLTDLLGDLSSEEREILKKSFDDIVRDTPQTTVAANQFKRIAAKVGKIAAEQLRKLVVDIASETAKKIIWP